jgi:hypothetical protein
MVEDEQRARELRMLTWGYAWGFMAGMIAAWWSRR